VERELTRDRPAWHPAVERLAEDDGVRGVRAAAV